MDLTIPRIQKKWLRLVSTGRYFAVVVTPPCSTFSRAVWANDEGPYPLRSAHWPRGFPWNSKARRDKAEVGNVLGDFSFEVMKRQVKRKRSWAAMEQPEDLGQVRKQRVPGHWPASLWQFPQHEDLLRQCPDLQSVVLAQVDFGGKSVKPTRLLVKAEEIHPEMYPGLPQFDPEGWYLGPLPRKVGAPLIGHDGTNFNTAAAAAWPPQLCEWAAKSIISSFNNSASEGKGDASEDITPGAGKILETPVEKEVAKQVDPTFPPVRGGRDLPRRCNWKGYMVPFHDGGCLPSPGRWDPEHRSLPGGEWEQLRKEVEEIIERRAGGPSGLEKECFAMATGERGCKLVKDEELLEELRGAMHRFGGGDPDDLMVPEGQPFRLRLMRRLLKEAGDPDWEFLERAEEGLPVGVLEPLPRTPSVFEEQVKWNLEEDPLQPHRLEKANYPSAREHADHLRSHLEAEVAEGLVEKMSRDDFVKEFGENRAIAALAVLVEDPVVGKKRVIHDGSHDVQVNHRIKTRDKIRMPGAREKRYVLESLKRKREVAFSLIGDFGKAHRRFKYQRREQGFLGCVVDETDQCVYVNKVGTFGITSTPYWWTRLSGALLRLVHYFMVPGTVVEFLLYADDLEGVGVGRRGRISLVIAYCIMAALGAPFKWSKQRGGTATEWVGLTTDYGKYSFGLSEKRSTWLRSWIDGLLTSGLVEPGEFAAGLGRLSFASLALPWEKPFLGPLFAWTAAVLPQRGAQIIPWAVGMILKWISSRLGNGGRLEEVALVSESEEVGPIIWTDAKATEEQAWIGGYLQTSERSEECSWFSLEVKETIAPWLRCRGGSPKRVIAALEMLATLVAVKIWAPVIKGRMQAKITAKTDNQGNGFVLKKFMTSKYPGTVLLMEMAEELRYHDVSLDLQWVRRDSNQVADDLTNLEFGKFSMGRRIELEEADVKWKVFDKLDGERKSLYDHIQGIKEAAKRKKMDKKMYRPLRGKRQKILPKW